MTEELLELERAAWDALLVGGAAGPFYETHLAPQVLMLLPGGMVIDDRQAVIDAMGGPPWSSYHLRDERVLQLGPNAAIVAYCGVVQRGDDPPYEALFNSTWVRIDGNWRLALHQQTPV